MSNALPPEQPCTDPRHTGAIREQLGCTSSAPMWDRVMAAIRAEYLRRIEMQIAGSPEEHVAALTDAAVTVLPAEHCGHQPPHAISGYGLLTECVLRPGHSGSHADEHGMRWWLSTSSPAEAKARADEAQQPETEARPTQTEWVVESLWRNGEWRSYYPGRHTRDEARQDHTRAVNQDADHSYRVIRMTTTYTEEESG